MGGYTVHYKEFLSWQKDNFINRVFPAMTPSIEEKRVSRDEGLQTRILSL